MRKPIRNIVLVAAAAAALGACSENNLQGGKPGSSASVLGLASATSETAAPLAINDGAFVFDDTSEVSDPININN